MRTSFKKAAGFLRPIMLLGAGVVLGGGLGPFWSPHPGLFVAPAHAQEAARTAPPDPAALQADVQRLKDVVPDQSHAMADVGYHFANLWFAGARTNWSLARFYLDETRSHLKWAVRIIPVRKDSAGRDVDLRGILEAVDSAYLSEVSRAIENQSSVRFTNAYRQTLVGCYSCHKASSKPYLRPRIPEFPAAPIVNFDPEAKWPE